MCLTADCNSVNKQCSVRVRCPHVLIVQFSRFCRFHRGKRDKIVRRMLKNREPLQFGQGTRVLWR